MTDSFIKAVEAEPGTTYGRLLSAMRTRIRDGQGSRRLPGRLGSFVRWMIPSSGVQVIFFISTRRDCWTASLTLGCMYIRRSLSFVLQRCLTSTGSHSCSDLVVSSAAS